MTSPVKTRDVRPAEHRQRLWIGGSPCSGKSTIVDALCRVQGWQSYHCDEHWDRHMASATALSQPRMTALRALGWDEIWMRDVAVQVEDELALYREEFPMILNDLAGLDACALALVEGTALLPDLVAPLLSSPREAIWLVPTEAFQRQTYRTRGSWVQGILAQCSEPEAAWENWMARDAAYARWVTRAAEERGLKVIQVDGSKPIDAIQAEVAAWLAPELRSGG